MKRSPPPRCLAVSALALGAAAGAAWAGQGEEALQLQAGPGRDLTTSHCAICHSLEYIPGNAPAMDRAGWQKSVQKMRERFGAPVTDEQAAAIVEYLSGAYAEKR